MNIDPKMQQEVSQRLAESEKERETTRHYLNQGDLLKANTPERIEKRKGKLLENNSLTPLIGEENRQLLIEQPVQEASQETQRAFERIINGRDTQPCWFLTRGAEIRRTVGRIDIRDTTRHIGWATGFLVAPNLLLTNQHVLDSLKTARSSRVEFDYEETFTGDLVSGSIFNLDPDTFFVCDPAKEGLDYALVAVAPKSRSESGRTEVNLSEFRFNVLIQDEGKIALGEVINCIHHPEGQGRQASLRENTLTAILENWLHYETDTEQGSSGAPLYNNQWQVIGIHHAGVEKRDQQGNILAIGGMRWTQEMGERAKWWEANEGLRISRFIAHVKGQVAAALNSNIPPLPERVVTSQGKALFEAMLQPSGSSIGGTDLSLGNTSELLEQMFNPE